MQAIRERELDVYHGVGMQPAGRFEAVLTDDRRYRLLVDAVFDYAIFMLNLDGTVASWNPGAQRFKGYAEAEILGQHFSRFYTEEDRLAGLPQRALRLASEEGRFEGEGWRQRKDGTRFWAHVVIDPIRDSGTGRLLGFAKVTRDLTERREAEQKLRDSEQRFRLLVQSVTDYAIYMLDPQGIVINWNQGAQRIKGYTPDEIVGRHFSTFYTDEDRTAGEPEKALAAALRDGRYEKEAWRQRKDGSRFWANVVIDAVRDESGALIGFAKVTRDITERRNTQRALEEAREALFQSQKIEALGRLTGGVAHDFNNLLMAILGSLNLVRKRLPDDPKVMAFIDNAIQGAQRGATLTRRLLSFARRQEMKAEAVDIPALVHGMAGLLQRSLGPSVLLESRFPIGLDKALVDANQLETALLNLAVNARDAMPEGGSIVISGRMETVLAGHPSLKPGRYLCLALRDDGEGMDAETLARATEPFFTTKGVGKGTGLGLAMVLGMAEQSGGQLALRSRPGEGTTAELWLPAAAPVAQVPADQRGDRLQMADIAAANEPKLTVLAVDDDGLVLMNTVAMLEDLGHLPLRATSGRQALDVLRREGNIDLVITDHAMPQMNGVQLAREIRSQHPHMPIVLATGYAELPDDISTDLPRLDKPYMQDDLARAIRKAMQRGTNPGPII